jgi:hypothetical protein
VVFCWRWLVLAPTVSLTAACSLVVDTDGLSGGGSPPPTDGASPDATSPTDASSPADTASSPDTAGPTDSAIPVDAASPPPDGSPGPDGDAASQSDQAAPQDGPPPPPDGTAGGPDAATTFCMQLTPKPQFCDDFDEGSATAGWSQVHQTLGKLGLTTSEFVSPPASLIVSASPSGAGADATGHYVVSLSGQSLVVSVTASLRVDASSSGIADLLVLSFSDGSGNTYLLQAEISAGGSGGMTMNLPETYAPQHASQTYVDHFGVQPWSSGNWTTFTMTMTAPLAGGTGTANLAYGAGHISASINVPISLASVDFAAGLAYVQNGGWTVALDNVTFDAVTN